MSRLAAYEYMETSELRALAAPIVGEQETLRKWWPSKEEADASGLAYVGSAFFEDFVETHASLRRRLIIALEDRQCAEE